MSALAVRGHSGRAGRASTLCAILLLFVAAAALAADPYRHPLEDRALVNPEAVLQQLPNELAAANAAGDERTVALLQLARANACRVIANWTCQRSAGVDAIAAAVAAGDATLEVRGLIAEARALMALQDYSRGERLLGRAALRLGQAPNAEYAADIDLAFSSLSFSLGKHALATEYADRGLARLGPDEALPMQVRLLRNRARSLLLTDDKEGARASLDQALLILQRFEDPKLSAELYLESARLAASRGDIAAQRENARKVLALSEELRNSQLGGLGHEALARAALAENKRAEALQELGIAFSTFRTLGLSRDEVRVARDLIRELLDAGRGVAELEPVLRRYFMLDLEISQADRAQAADDFDARLAYVEREAKVARLENEAMLAQERELSLAATNRLNQVVTALSIGSLLVLALFLFLQRRLNRRLRTALSALRESESRATDLLQLSTGYVFLHDRRGQLLMVNPATARALGYSPRQMVGRNVRELLPPEAMSDFDRYLTRVLKAGRAEGQLQLRTADGSDCIWRYANRLAPAEAGHSYVVGHAVDVTEHLAETEELRELSERDALTGCFNRRYLEEFDEQHPRISSWAAVNIDLDHFKQVNDRLGHDAGDRVLIAFADFLRARARDKDAVVRVGGDEFLVLLPGADASAATALVARLTQEATHAPTPFSLGWAVREGDEPLSETLLRADQAMFKARASARGVTPTREPEDPPVSPRPTR